jgi:hypothetical protein
MHDPRPKVSRIVCSETAAANLKFKLVESVSIMFLGTFSIWFTKHINSNRVKNGDTTGVPSGDVLPARR